MAEAVLGLRDYGWVNPYLPGKVGAMDIDFCLAQSSSGRMLLQEHKPRGARISTGARLTFKQFREMGVDVWSVHDLDDGTVRVAPLDETGKLLVSEVMTKDALGQLVREWWMRGLS